MMAMDPVFKAAWVTALRSGGYKQGQHFLRQVVNGEEKFCGLGVGCNLLNSARWSDRISPHANDIVGFYNYNGCCSIPDKATCEQLGLTIDQARHLSCMNDTGYNFNEIADFIEKNF